MATDALPGELLDRVQQLSAQIDQLSDARARELAQELVAAVIAMYGDGLARIMEVISESREAGATILDELSQDGAVASLLLIHDLYPVSLEQRVIEALDTVRPYMESHGGNVELIGIDDGVAKLACRAAVTAARPRGRRSSWRSSRRSMSTPRISPASRLQGVTEEPAFGNGAAALPMAGVELPIVHSNRAAARRRAAACALGAGSAIPGARRPARCGRSRSTAWRSARRRRRPAAGVRRRVCVVRSTLSDGELRAAMLRCAACDAEFDLPRAGRAAGGEPLQLTSRAAARGRRRAGGDPV